MSEHALGIRVSAKGARKRATFFMDSPTLCEWQSQLELRALEALGAGASDRQTITMSFRADIN
jgi:hypothetical protein